MEEDRELKAREKVESYDQVFKSGWPPRIFVWAWNRMPIEMYKKYRGSDAIDFYKKLANKKEYFLLIAGLGLKKTFHEEHL